MKIKIIAILALLFFVGSVFWIVPILRDRYYADLSIKNKAQDSPTGIENEFLKNENNNDETETIDFEQENSLQETYSSDENYLEVKDEDCSNKCEDFKKDEKNLEYCQEFCGFNLTEENPIDSQKIK